MFRLHLLSPLRHSRRILVPPTKPLNLRLMGDVTGYGGFLEAGFPEAITKCDKQRDVIIVGFTGRQTRFVYTGNDIVPFLFYTV